MSALPVISFSQALAETREDRRHLLLGNGFSIGAFPERFKYEVLFEQANFESAPEARRAFPALGTTDFEVVIEALRRGAQLIPLYAAESSIADRMNSHAEILKELLVQAIAGRHPERPSDLSEIQYRACRRFLAHFAGQSRILKGSGKTKDRRGKIYTLNYDLLLYWVLLHDDVQPSAEEPASSEMLEHDDGFRAPEGNENAPYVTWEAEGAADGQNIHFLHGALHLYDVGADVQKKCWQRSGGIPLVEQIRNALSDGKFPLFVAEGEADVKLARIRHSGYLQRSLKSFAGVCRPAAGVLFIFGHSFGPSDEHILKIIEKGKLSRLYVSIFGDIHSPQNKILISRARRLRAARADMTPIDVKLFAADDAQVWSSNGQPYLAEAPL